MSSELFLNLWSGTTFILILYIVEKHKTEDISLHYLKKKKKNSIRGSQRSRGCILLMGMYGQSQGLSLLICLFRDMHVGDAPWRALLVRILCMSVCVIDAGNHAKKKNALRMFKWKIFHLFVFLMFREPAKIEPFTWFYKCIEQMSLMNVWIFIRSYT